MKTGFYFLNFNYKDFLPWAIKSALMQTRKPDVIILVDDHSTDGSLDMVAKHFPHANFDEVIVNPENIGAVRSMNNAAKFLGEVHGCDVICGLAADDVFDPAYIEKTTAVMENSPGDVGFVYTWVRRIGDENKMDMHPEFSAELLMKIPYVHGSALIRYEAWKQVGGLPDVKREEDWAMYRAMVQKGWKGKLIPEPLLRWRKHNLGCRTMMNDFLRGARRV